MGTVTHISDGSEVGDVLAALNQAHRDGELDFIAAVAISGTHSARLLGGEAQEALIIASVHKLNHLVTALALDDEKPEERIA